MRGFSVLPRGFCHESLKAVPPPLNVSCRVLIAIEDQTTGGTDMGAYGETLLYACPTAATILAGVRGWDGHDSTAGAFCLAFENLAEAIPPSIVDRLVEASLLTGTVIQIATVAIGLRLRTTAHIGYLQVFQIDHVVLSYQIQRGLVMEVSPLPLYLLMLPSTLLRRLAPVLTALLSARHAPLRFLQFPFGTAIMTGILYNVSCRSDEKHLQPNVDTGLPITWGQRLCGHIRTRDAGVPSIRLSDKGNCLGRTLQRPMAAEVNAANLGEVQDLAIDRGAAMLTHLRIGERVVSVPALEAGIAGLLAILDTAEEGSKGFIQPMQDILQHLGIDAVILRAYL